MTAMEGRYFLYKSAIAASLAGFLFGFDTVVISGAEQTIQSLWKLSSSMHGLAVSTALWGTVLGSLLGGWPTEIFGRKHTLLWIGVLYLASSVGSALAPEVFSFMFFRFIAFISRSEFFRQEQPDTECAYKAHGIVFADFGITTLDIALGRKNALNVRD